MGLSNLVTTSFVVAGGRLFAGAEGGVFVSGDNGASWTPTNRGLPEARYVNALILSGAALYVGIGPTGGVYRSDDFGQNWVAVNTGITDRDIRALVSLGGTLLVNSPNLYAGIFDGIYLSTDQGASWLPANTGLTHRNVFSLAVIGSTLFAGTIGGGVYASQ